ncbi:hypothetical protein PHLCEN_2v7879 [Hermanssonia centrifuga]|uniref:Uncharacterized protein n=1 Tax=Hermanssonia centrifuga TaxID=98765 RepID=A0A2R6NVU9_9APHY|nr:hypothetical protein PHLCEN_2v7879 [Hermanssonia centrifuga]
MNNIGRSSTASAYSAVKHIEKYDFWSVYANKLGFLTSVNENDIYIRTSPADRTFQVSSALLTGMDPSEASKTFPVITQPSPIDNITPSYSCPNANNVRNAYQSVPAWTDHLQANADLKARLDATLGTAGLSDWASWCVFLQELMQNFELFRSGKETFKMRFFVGHDGTMIRVASALGLGILAPLRWPALGSEIVMEVWKVKGSNFVRVLHEGTPVSSLEWVTLDEFIQLLASQIPPDIFAACNSS